MLIPQKGGMKKMASKKKTGKKSSPKPYVPTMATAIGADENDRDGANRLFYRFTGTQSSQASRQRNGEDLIEDILENTAYVIGAGDASKVPDRGAAYSMLEGMGLTATLRKGLKAAAETKHFDIRTVLGDPENDLVQGLAQVREIVVGKGVLDRIYANEQPTREQINAMRKGLGRQRAEKELADHYKK